MTRLARVLALASLLGGVGFFSAAIVSAHEIGTSRVSVQFTDDGAYTIELVTDARSLVAKLEASSGQPSSGTPNPIALAPRLESFEELFRRRIAIAFDGSPACPSIAYSVTATRDVTSISLAKIRFSGQVPGGARTFTWQYGWTFASYALVIRGPASAAVSTEWLEGGTTSKAFPLTRPAAETSWAGTARRYFVLGFTHILPEGLDHVLFVLGLFLLTGRARSILWQVSAFTIAHSITLGLSMYGIISAPAAIVEPMIALSIAYVAIENLFLSELKSWRLALVFAFGLLHGMGFAGALRELGLPRSEFLTALVTFNLGVEAGQLAEIATAVLVVGWHWSPRPWYRQRIVVPASAAIACVAVYWTVVRIGL